jgi:hypothetical protein
MSGDDRAFFNEGGPPDPISYLRRISDGDGPYIQNRSDSADDDPEDFISDSSMPEGGGDQKPLASKRQKKRPTQQEDQPARERPPPGQDWSRRENLSFTRSLIFYYGAGAVTHEHDQHVRILQNVVHYVKSTLVVVDRKSKLTL